MLHDNVNGKNDITNSTPFIKVARAMDKDFNALISSYKSTMIGKTF